MRDKFIQIDKQVNWCNAVIKINNNHHQCSPFIGHFHKVHTEVIHQAHFQVSNELLFIFLSNDCYRFLMLTNYMIFILNENNFIYKNIKNQSYRVRTNEKSTLNLLSLESEYIVDWPKHDNGVNFIKIWIILSKIR